MPARILERLVGETGEPERVIEAARALGERIVPTLNDALKDVFATPLEIEFGEATIRRMADAGSLLEPNGSISVVPSESSPDALVMAADGAAIALAVAALFGADGEEVVQAPEREPTPTELDVVALVFEIFARVANGSGDRAMTLRLPPPPPLSGKDLARLKLRDGPGVCLRFQLRLPGGTGTIALTMPQRVLLKHRGNGGAAADADAEQPAWRARFGEEIMRSSLQLTATVSLDKMTLGALSELQAGQVIALPTGAQARTRLSARGRTLFVCEFGKLGQNYTLRVAEEFDAGKEWIDGLLPG